MMSSRLMKLLIILMSFSLSTVALAATEQKGAQQKSKAKSAQSGKSKATKPRKVGKVYMYRNEDGSLVFTDSPTDTSSEVNMNVNPITTPSYDTSILDQDLSKPKPAKATEISIVDPVQKSTIRDNTGSFYVSGRITPKFEPGMRVTLLVDGKQYGKAQSKALFPLRNIHRGEHSLQLKLMDRSGKVIAESEMITIYMFRNSKLN